MTELPRNRKGPRHEGGAPSRCARAPPTRRWEVADILNAWESYFADDPANNFYFDVEARAEADALRDRLDKLPLRRI